MFACGDTTSVGAQLLEEEDLSVSFTDTVDIKARTILVDSVLVFDSLGYVPPFLLLGNYSDPVFGDYRSSIYTEARLISPAPAYHLNAQIDSIVLVLILNREYKFGDTTAYHNIKVFKVNERINMNDQIFSDQEHPFDEIPIGELPSHRLDYDSVRVYNPVLDSTVLEEPQIRIPLSSEFVNSIYTLLIGAENDAEFLQLINALHIQSESTSNSMYSIDVTVSGLESRLAVYYVQEDTVDLIYNYPITGYRFNHFDHDYSGSVVESFIGDEQKGDSLLFVQGMAGVNIQFDMSNIFSLEDVLLNYAELELTVAEIPEDDPERFPPLNDLVASWVAADGTVFEILDFQLGVEANNIQAIFGGKLEEIEGNGVVLKKYKMNITSHLKSVINHDLSSDIIISAFNTLNYPNRSVIFGPNHTSYPARINITYTKL